MGEGDQGRQNHRGVSRHAVPCGFLTLGSGHRPYSAAVHREISNNCRSASRRVTNCTPIGSFAAPVNSGSVIDGVWQAVQIELNAADPVAFSPTGGSPAAEGVRMTSYALKQSSSYTTNINNRISLSQVT